MKIKLYNNSCFTILDKLPDKSIDIFISDLPYCSKNFGKCTTKQWDQAIDLGRLWVEFKRLRKNKNTPFFFFGNMKHGWDLIESNKRWFRYQFTWIKSASVGFLNARKMPLKKTEFIFVFYEKLCFYDISSHKHKFIKSNRKTDNKDLYNINNKYKESYKKYDPPLPNNVIEDKMHTLYGEINIKNDIVKKRGNERKGNYDPKLPDDVLRIKSERGKHSTQKPVAIYEFLLKYYSKPEWTCLDATCGSGSCGVACKNMNRSFIGIEKDEKIFKIAEDRLFKNYKSLKKEQRIQRKKKK